MFIPGPGYGFFSIPDHAMLLYVAILFLFFFLTVAVGLRKVRLHCKDLCRKKLNKLNTQNALLPCAVRFLSTDIVSFHFGTRLVHQLRVRPSAHIEYSTQRTDFILISAS